MTPRELAEYTAIRETIRDRGTARVWVFVAGLLGWAGLVIATAALAALPLATLLPLLLLAGVFEAVFSLHTGVERLGRYIQVFFEDEDDGARKWEHAAMAFGRANLRAGTDPLFAAVFLAATLLNFVPVLIAEPVAIEVVLIGGAHLLLIARIVLARRAAGRQRALDLERFQQIKATSAPARS